MSCHFQLSANHVMLQWKIILIDTAVRSGFLCARAREQQHGQFHSPFKLGSV